MSDRVGQRLGNYHLTRTLGSGSFADVYLGEQVYLQTQAAVKVLHARLNAEDLDGFLAEARTIAHLVHPAIVRVLDFGVEDSTPYLVMDYAPNGTLRQRHARSGPLPLQTVLPYVKQVGAALQYAHFDKIIHRDVKPDNMLVGPYHTILLSDFGLAMMAHSSLSEKTGGVAGTMVYMAPEQLRGKPRPASDQYSLAVAVYQWLTGTLPFRGSLSEIAAQIVMAQPPSLRAQVPTIAPAVEQVVLRALAKDPKQRFASVQEFGNALEQASLAGDARSGSFPQAGSEPSEPPVSPAGSEPSEPPVSPEWQPPTPVADALPAQEPSPRWVPGPSTSPVLPGVPALLPCGHGQRDPNQRFCSLCGRPVSPEVPRH
jgi:serine/threonine protein kinase